MRPNKTELIQKIKQLEGITQEERSYLIGLVNTKKKYGLVWEDKLEEAAEQLRGQLPVLREVVERRIMSESGFAGLKDLQDKGVAPKATSLFPELENQENPSNHPNHSSDAVAPNHILIEGDNLHALTALTYTHEGRIDVIYIDPPYNTGNKDFKYNDAFVEREDSYRHSKWLSFMDKRLRIAKRLLSDNGIIFISIDDNELSQLRLLSDEIFFEQNFIEYFSWVKTSTPPGLSKKSRKTVEYVMCFEKRRNSTKYQGELIDGGDAPLLNTGNNRRDILFPKESVIFKVAENIFQAGMYDRVELKNKIVVINGKADADFVLNGEFKWTQETVDKEILNGTYFLIKSEKFSIRFQRKEIDTHKSPTNLIRENIITPIINKKEQGVETNEQATSEILNILGNISFDYPKPVSLIKYFLNFFPSRKLRILDFFAGSGTTLHATMQLNAEDGGNRQCILVTNNENNICEEVTYERNRRVIHGYTNSKGEWVKGLTNNNLRYYKTEFVPSLKDEPNKRMLTQASTDLLCIKEDCYTELTESVDFNPTQCRIFTNDRGKYLAVVFYSRRQMEVYEQLTSYILSLENLSEPVKLYAFSPEKETLTEDFAEVADKIEAVPLPEAIYNAYRSVFKTLKLDRGVVETTHALSLRASADENELADPNQDPE